ncbi:group III truncated hemoglobin [Crocinitomicaceae bacterium]|nr:group III truncated hemoglobin [Crocinitomicaceae bacterium]
MADIQTKEDIELLVNSFYTKVLKDETLAPFFARLDFDRHLPKMVHFWSFVLLDEADYTTDVTKTHINMPLKKEHFDQWIHLFSATTDELFSGENAHKAKQRAFLIRWTIESKINYD